MKIGPVTVEGGRVMVAGPRFLTTMQIPVLAGREIDDRDQPGSTPVAVISERLARTYFGNENPVGQAHHVRGRQARFRNRRRFGQSAVRWSERGEFNDRVRTGQPDFSGPSDLRPAYSGEPLSYVRNVHEIVREADSRIPVTNVVTQAGEIDRTISREVTFAKLCTGFAVLALLMACVGSTERCRTTSLSRSARLESVWLWARNAAPSYGWFCAAFCCWRRRDSRSACLPR